MVIDDYYKNNGIMILTSLPFGLANSEPANLELAKLTTSFPFPLLILKTNLNVQFSSEISYRQIENINFERQVS